MMIEIPIRSVLNGSERRCDVAILILFIEDEMDLIFRKVRL